MLLPVAQSVGAFVVPLLPRFGPEVIERVVIRGLEAACGLDPYGKTLPRTEDVVPQVGLSRCGRVGLVVEGGAAPHVAHVVVVEKLLAVLERNVERAPGNRCSTQSCSPQDRGHRKPAVQLVSSMPWPDAPSVLLRRHPERTVAVVQQHASRLRSRAHRVADNQGGLRTLKVNPRVACATDSVVNDFDTRRPVGRVRRAPVQNPVGAARERVAREHHVLRHGRLQNNVAPHVTSEPVDEGLTKTQPSTSMSSIRPSTSSVLVWSVPVAENVRFASSTYRALENRNT
jgi:hypothetical protein